MTYKFAAWLCVSLASSMALASSYTVRNGDNDWAIAHRLHISLKQLHEMNPSVNWDAIQPGRHLDIPSDSSSETSHHSSRTSEHVHGGGHYTVREDDNDWTIAAKLGITQRALHALNPDVRWTRIQPGQKLVVPASVASLSSHPIHHIETRYARINGDNVTLRRGPGTDEDKVTSVDEGTEARVLDRDHGWYKLRFPKGTVAWVRGDFLSAVHRETRTYASTGRRHRREHTYTASYRRHRHSASLPLLASEIGDSQVIRTATSYLGTRYRTGGTSRSSGFDCSGLTSTVLRQNGVRVPRTAREQSGVGQRVDKGGLKKGDLVFFRTNRSTRVNHVGMYIGNGKFIHASSGGGHVQVSSLNEGYYSRRFAGARRVLKASGTSKKTAKTEKSK